MAWRVARSLDALLGQLNTMAPKRSKVSDGSIGDAAHATRDSDHNPWVKVAGTGVVTARDFTHDPAGGLDCEQLAKALVASGDQRIKYVIWRRRIWTPGKGWQKYSGTNPHDKHLHLSVSADAAQFDSTASWPVTAAPARPAPPEDDMFDPAQHIEAIAQAAARAVVERQVSGDRPLWQVLAALDSRDPNVNPVAQAVVDRTVVGDLTLWQALQQQAGLLQAVASRDATQIAAAVPADLAKQVADELVARLKS